MTEKIYAISCRQDLTDIGVDRMRSSVDGLEEATMSLDWSNTRVVPVIVSEKVIFQEGETRLVPIRPIRVPAYAMVFQSFYGMSGMGNLDCIGCTDMKMYFEDKTANVSMFTSRIKASALRGDLLGQILIVEGKKKI